MAEAVERLIMRLFGSFGEPRTPMPAELISELRRIASRYSPEVIEMAGTALVESSTFWPRPSELRTALDKAAFDLGEPERAREAERRAREQAAAEAEAKRRAVAPERMAQLMAEFRSKMAAVVQQETPRAKRWDRVDREAFRDVQAASPNISLHRGG